MTSHELARLLLSHPDRLVLNEGGFPIERVRDLPTGRCINQDGHVYNYALPPSQEDSRFEREFWESLEKIQAIVLQ